MRVGEVLDSDVGDPEQHAGSRCEQERSRRQAKPRRVEILTSPTPSAMIALSKAISAASEARCGPSALAVRPMTTKPAAVMITPAH